MISRIYSAAYDLYAEAPQRRDPCCSWVARVLLRATDLDGEPDFREGGGWWRRANIYEDPPNVWSSVGAAAELRQAAGWPSSPVRTIRTNGDLDRLAREVVSGLTPGAWHVLQGWGSTTPGQLAGGHTWLWWSDPSDPELGVAVESSEARGVRTSGITGVPEWGAAQREHLTARIRGRRYRAGVGLVAVEQG